jgi:hypothetical protein
VKTQIRESQIEKEKTKSNNEVAITGLQHYQRQRGNPSVARCHHESTESEVTMTTDAKNNCVYRGEVERTRQQVCVVRRALARRPQFCQLK